MGFPPFRHPFRLPAVARVHPGRRFACIVTFGGGCVVKDGMCKLCRLYPPPDTPAAARPAGCPFQAKAPIRFARLGPGATLHRSLGKCHAPPSPVSAARAPRGRLAASPRRLARLRDGCPHRSRLYRCRRRQCVCRGGRRSALRLAKRGVGACGPSPCARGPCGRRADGARPARASPGCWDAAIALALRAGFPRIGYFSEIPPPAEVVG